MSKEQEEFLAEASKRLSRIAELNGMLPAKLPTEIILGNVSLEEVDKYIEAKEKVLDFEMEYFRIPERGFIF